MGKAATTYSHTYSQLPKVRGDQEAESSDRDSSSNEFLSRAAHDLKAPLNNLYLASEFLLNPAVEEERKREFTALIHRTTRDLVELADAVLDMSKLQAGQEKLHYSRTDLPAFMEKLVGAYRPSIVVKQIGITLSVSLGIETLSFDHVQITRVLNNLLSNALEVSEPESLISVRVTKERGMIKFAVTDQGPGIEKRDLGKLFFPFPQISRRRSGNKTGTGLGLAICRKLVQLHGGTIGVSTQIGLGSCFYFSLPLKDQGDRLQPENSVLISPVRGASYATNTGL